MIAKEIKTYPIVETFHSIQGEGYWTGTNAFFIRLGGCDVYCPWCDQKESWNQSLHPHISVTKLVEKTELANSKIIIITGGEPLIHNLFPLTSELKKLGKKIHLETSGAHPFSGEFDWVTFSPKTFKPPHESIYNFVNELKIVIATPEDLEWAISQSQKIPKDAVKCLQPEWNTPHSKDLIFNYVLENPQWRVSLQTHKYMEVR